MKLTYKCLGLVMFVMLICCVSAVSATDVDNITVPDDTDVIEIDDIVDSVEEVEIDEVDDSVDDASAADNSGKEQILRGPGKINGNTNISAFFNTDGTLKNNVGNSFTFTDNFTSLGSNFGNFKINRAVTLNVAGATFDNIGFDLLYDGLTLNGGTFTGDASSTNGATINVGADEVTVSNVNINVTAPPDANFYAINVLEANNVNILNNTIYYYSTTATDDYVYNYVVKVRDSQNVTVANNIIIAKLYLKDVDYRYYEDIFPDIDTDLIAGVAVNTAYRFNFTNNTLDIRAVDKTGWYPTLDALIIVDSENASITKNKITEIDEISGQEETNYLYAVDVYQCYNIRIEGNEINLNSEGGNLTVNGTGAAYGIQLTGDHTGVVIANNNITTASNGPNLGIYSQNYEGATELTIYGNIIKVTGRAGNHPWALVSGMELQDTRATVYNNTIYVNNTNGYVPNYCAYGISYSQSTGGGHWYNITYNNVTVYNGDYTVYIAGGTGSVNQNYLTATNSTGVKHGNNTVYAPGLNVGVNY